MINGFRLAATIVLPLLIVVNVTVAAQGGPFERQKIDEAAATRGRAVYAQHCINCHGSTAKGSERGPDLIRSVVVLRDRLGNGIGPAITPSATHQSALTNEQVVDLSHFLHQRIEAIASNRNPRVPINVLTGELEAGKAYFHGAGTCSTCHSATGDLQGLATRINDPVALQQRWLFPTLRRERREVDVTRDGKKVSGVLVRLDDFAVTLKDASGTDQTFDRGPGVTVVVRDPLAAHRTLLDRYTDTNMHDLTTYLWTLK
jgi:mono/diheme cytochrome c family protein